MKKIIYFTLFIFLTAIMGCTDKFEEFNTDNKNPETVPGEPLFSNAQKELSDFINNTNVNINIFKLMAQYWTETTYIDEANYDLITRNISSNIYFRLYVRVLTDLKEAAEIIETYEVLPSEEAAKQNKLQIIEMLNVYTFSKLVDIFGSVPYSEALNPDNVYPEYESGQEIYNDLFARLNAALANLDVSAGSFGSADLYYGGDTEAWAKFGNTLRVRLAITIADVNDAKAKAEIESAYADAFSSNDDNALLNYLSSSPNYNQLYADLVASGRKDFVPANTIVDIMNELDDPRRDAYFRDKQDTSSVEGVEKLAYVGGEYGYPNSYSQYSHISATIEMPDFPGFILTYTELCFYLAEAVERGYNIEGTAEEWYNRGITSSFAFWDVDGVEQYLAQPGVAYSTAEGTWRQKIGVQSWISNYPRGDQAYTNWRRLDYPVLNLPEEASAYEDIPVRFTFPVNEQTLNAANYKEASEAIGGDLITTKVFWDVN